MRRHTTGVAEREYNSARNRYSLAALLSFLGFVVGGCTGGMSAPPPAPQSLTVTLSKSAATVDVGTTLNLTAAVNDPKNAGVTWTLTGGGTLSNRTTTSVTYTGPASAGSATITATAVSDTSKAANATVTVAPLPQVVAPAQIPAVTIGHPYSLQLTVTGGTSPFIWSVTQGQLPKGLSLDAKSGLISGTAQSAVVMQSQQMPNAASSATTVTATVQVADGATPSESSAVTLNFQVVGGDASVLGFVYVAGDGVVSEFSIGTDGSLMLLRPQPGAALARSPGAGDNVLVVDPLHRFVYGVGIRGSEVFEYKIAADGTLSELGNVALGDPSVQATGMVMAPGGSAIYVSSNLGVHQFSVGSDGRLQPLGPPVGPATGSGAACIAIDPSFSIAGGGHVYTCRGHAVDSYHVNTNATLTFQATSPLNEPVAPSQLAIDGVGSSLLIAANGDHLNAYRVQSGAVTASPDSTGPADAPIFDLSIPADVAFTVGGDLIVPTPPGGGTNDHLSLYSLSTGKLGAPEKRDTGRGPGHVLAITADAVAGPTVPLPLVYVTNSRDNNVAQCIPSAAPRCPTVAISTQDMDPTGVTGFLGSPGN